MYKYLNNIDSPADLKKLRVDELPLLAEEIRDAIIGTVSSNGGHLSSSLGVVELTIALHYVFDAPKDRIVWDVGHQAYAHKLLTGRRKAFRSLRQYGGISGFPRREESRYDVFTVGHSSTSISAALGMVEARDLRGEDHKVIAVIGDGSMTAGLAFEGLNQGGASEKDLIIVLNDNEMSISPNVGALSSYLSRHMTGDFYVSIQKIVENVLKNIPGIGGSMLKAAKRLEDSLKGLIVPGMVFEELGFEYVGPIKGHRFDRLIQTFENVKKLKRPVLVHVATQKGKGYEPAEKNPSVFHGVGPFERKTGKILGNGKGVPTYTEVFGKLLTRLAFEDESIVAVSAAMPEGTGLHHFARKFPGRFFDVGIAEQHGITFSAGLAAEGFKPVAAIYSTFMQRAYDQILHDVCLPDLPVVLAMDRGGLVGDDGPTHHGNFDLSYLRHIPNIILMSPKDENELQNMLKTALDCNHPAAIRYPRGAGTGVELEPYPHLLTIGEAERLTLGEDVAILAMGHMVYPSLQAARLLKKKGINATVVNARFVKPLDLRMIREVLSETNHLVTVEENVLMGGFGSAVLEALEQEKIYDVNVLRIGLPDHFIEQGPQDLLRRKYGLDPEGIARKVEYLLHPKTLIIPARPVHGEETNR
ncbi:MAG: 1-deoxy-D-xylulose-5-phosphate synthase [bacterium]